MGHLYYGFRMQTQLRPIPHELLDPQIKEVLAYLLAASQPHIYNIHICLHTHLIIKELNPSQIVKFLNRISITYYKQGWLDIRRPCFELPVV